MFYFSFQIHFKCLTYNLLLKKDLAKLFDNIYKVTLLWVDISHNSFQLMLKNQLVILITVNN